MVTDLSSMKSNLFNGDPVDYSSGLVKINGIEYVKVIRFDARGFKPTVQTEHKLVGLGRRTVVSPEEAHEIESKNRYDILGCFAFCRFVDTYALTGVDSYESYANVTYLPLDSKVYLRNKADRHSQHKLVECLGDDVFVLTTLQQAHERALDYFRDRDEDEEELLTDDRNHHIAMNFRHCECILHEDTIAQIEDVTYGVNNSFYNSPASVDTYLNHFRLNSYRYDYNQKYEYIEFKGEMNTYMKFKKASLEDDKFKIARWSIPDYIFSVPNKRFHFERDCVLSLAQAGLLDTEDLRGIEVEHRPYYTEDLGDRRDEVMDYLEKLLTGKYTEMYMISLDPFAEPIINKETVILYTSIRDAIKAIPVQKINNTMESVGYLVLQKFLIEDECEDLEQISRNTYKYLRPVLSSVSELAIKVSSSSNYEVLGPISYAPKYFVTGLERFYDTRREAEEVARTEEYILLVDPQCVLLDRGISTDTKISYEHNRSADNVVDKGTHLYYSISPYKDKGHRISILGKDGNEHAGKNDITLLLGLHSCKKQGNNLEWGVTD